jgi:bleomycin hydrolase
LLLSYPYNTFTVTINKNEKMKRHIPFTLTTLLLLIAGTLMCQNRYKAVFRASQPGFYKDSIQSDDLKIKEKAEPQGLVKNFAVDLTSESLPNKPNLYKIQQWHNSPVSQGATNTCWCFSTTSFLESEIYRITKQRVRLSEMYTVYWEYVDKTLRYIRQRGNSAFAEGSEANAVTRVWKNYGAVPYESYTGLINGRKYHNHVALYGELKSYLLSMKENSSWNEEAGVETVKSIMNHYMGTPPSEVVVNGKVITPLQYMKEVLKVNPDDYVDILSYSQEPFYKHVEYKVPDNWWHSADYCNVPLEVYMATLKDVVRKGYTVAIGGDISEPGFDRTTQCAVIPDFDIPSSSITDDARQFRFSNNTTTDDHGMHLVGYLEKDNKDWYLIKDSGSGSRNSPGSKEFGYYFFTEDYVKLKMMDFMVHKDAVKELLEKFR